MKYFVDQYPLKPLWVPVDDREYLLMWEAVESIERMDPAARPLHPLGIFDEDNKTVAVRDTDGRWLFSESLAEPLIRFFIETKS